MVKATIVAPQSYLGALLELCQSARGAQLEIQYLNEHSVLLTYAFPLNEIVADFYSQVKSLTNGYASFDYEAVDAAPADIVRLDVLLNGRVVDAFSLLCHRTRAEFLGRKVCHNLAVRRTCFVSDETGFDLFSPVFCGVGRKRLTAAISKLSFKLECRQRKVSLPESASHPIAKMF